MHCSNSFIVVDVVLTVLVSLDAFLFFFDNRLTICHSLVVYRVAMIFVIVTTVAIIHAVTHIFDNKLRWHKITGILRGVLVVLISDSTIRLYGPNSNLFLLRSPG